MGIDHSRTGEELGRILRQTSPDIRVRNQILNKLVNDYDIMARLTRVGLSKDEVYFFREEGNPWSELVIKIGKPKDIRRQYQLMEFDHRVIWDVVAEPLGVFPLGELECLIMRRVQGETLAKKLGEKGLFETIVYGQEKDKERKKILESKVCQVLYEYLNARTRGFHEEMLDINRTKHGTLIEKAKTRIRRVLEDPVLDELSREVTRITDLMRNRPLTLIHGDVQKYNLLISNSDDVVIIDPDRSGLGEALCDVLNLEMFSPLDGLGEEWYRLDRENYGSREEFYYWWYCATAPMSMQLTGRGIKHALLFEDKKLAGLNIVPGKQIYEGIHASGMRNWENTIEICTGYIERLETALEMLGQAGVERGRMIGIIQHARELKSALQECDYISPVAGQAPAHSEEAYDSALNVWTKLHYG